MLLECNGEGVCDRAWGRCTCVGDIEGTFKGIAGLTNSEPLGNPPEGVVGKPPLNQRIEGYWGGSKILITSNQLAPSYSWATKYLGDGIISRNHRYFGKACEKLHCISYPDIFSYHGIKSDHTEAAYSHDNHEDGHRRYPNECSGELQGDCDTTTGKCVCKAGWYGHDCSQKGKGDGTVNRRLHLQFDPERQLRPDGSLRDRSQWSFSAEGVSTPQVDF